MRFDLNDEQRAVRDAVDDLCRSRWSSQSARAYGGGGDDAFWGELSAAGWAGAAVAEEFGGQGLGTVELALVCEALGRSLAPSTFFGNAAAAVLLAAAGDHAQRERWLPGMAGGEARGAVGTIAADGRALVFDGAGAAVFILVGAGGAVLTAADGCVLEPIEGVDLTRRLFAVSATATEALSGDVAAGVDRAEVLLSGELIGVANRAMDLAVEHARTREQFGRPIGAYQAVSHRCADMLLDVESARSAVLFAAWTADHNPAALPRAASIAKVAGAQGAWRVATSALQVHGGIGFTWEHDCHLLLRRAVASGHSLGSVAAHLDRVTSPRV